MHVDDFVYCGTGEWLKDVAEGIMKIFKISKSAQGCFRYIGLNVVQTSDAIYIDQDVYIDDLKRVKINPERALQKDEALNKDLGDPDLWRVRVYSDASHANLPNGGSQGGLIVFIEGNGRLSPIVWRSKRLDRVAKSPLASEVMEFAEAADAGCTSQLQ